MSESNLHLIKALSKQKDIQLSKLHLVVDKFDDPETCRGSLSQAHACVLVGPGEHRRIEVGLLLLGGEDGSNPAHQGVEGSIKAGVNLELQLGQLLLLPLQAVRVLRGRHDLKKMLSSQVKKGRSCSIAVEHTPGKQEIMGSNPTRWWAFSSSSIYSCFP